MWNALRYETVAWTSTGSVPTVRIEVSTDEGSSWMQLAAAAPDTGSYVVNVPDTPSDRCLVRVTGVENPAISDTSGGLFSIGGAAVPAALTVLSPNGGETWPRGGTATVRWDSLGEVDAVGIALSTDEGASWTTLTAGTANDGSVAVGVPDMESSRCLVWVYDARNDPWLNKPDADPLDVSDGLFRISQDGPPGPVGNTLRVWRIGWDAIRLEWAPNGVDADWLGSNVYGSVDPADVGAGRGPADLEAFRIGPGSFPDVPDVPTPGSSYDHTRWTEPLLFFTVRYLDRAGNLSWD
jgi:hypothetical protein